MADPTLKDVLAAIARLEKSQHELQKSQHELQKSQNELQKGQNELQKGQNELRTEMHKWFDDLDAELDKHASVTHRKIEADLTALKKRPPARTGRAPRRR